MTRQAKQHSIQHVNAQKMVVNNNNNNNNNGKSRWQALRDGILGKCSHALRDQNSDKSRKTVFQKAQIALGKAYREGKIYLGRNL